jgi:RNA recognition motif-containing protein
MNIYVGNLSYETTEARLQEAFEQYGQVESARIIMDKYTDRSRGFGFAEMPDESEGQAAIEGLHESELDGRTLTVNKARPKNDSQRSGRGGGRRDDSRPRRW